MLKDTWQIDVVPCRDDTKEFAIVERQASERIPLAVLGVEAGDRSERALVHADGLPPSDQHYHLCNSCRLDTQ